LLRAHPLLDAGVIAGPAFGRTLFDAGVEVQRWFGGASPVRYGVASFTDAAHAARRLSGGGSSWLLDYGAGLRVKLPGADGVLRVDVARGGRDGATAFTVGWERR
jgi:hypothetical protein